MKQVAATVAAVVLLASSILRPAVAGPYGDDLSKCLVKSTSSEDKSQLVEWIFFSIALNPRVAALTSIPDTKRDEANAKTGELFTRLIADSCKVETQQAVMYEGTAAISGAFQLLGQVAAQEIFADPAVVKGTEAFTKYIDSDRIEKALGASK